MRRVRAVITYPCITVITYPSTWSNNEQRAVHRVDYAAQDAYVLMGDCIEGTGFLLDMKGDCIEGTYDTLKQSAISKNAGGLGVAIHCIRSTGSYIKSTNGTPNSIVPMLRVYNNYVAIIADVPFDF